MLLKQLYQFSLIMIKFEFQTNPGVHKLDIFFKIKLNWKTNSCSPITNKH